MTTKDLTSQKKEHRSKRGAPESETHKTVSATARRWGVSDAAVYRMLERKAMPCLRIGQAIRIPVEAINAYEAKQLAADTIEMEVGQC